MKFITRVLLILAAQGSCFNSIAQEKFAEGFFTSEAKAIGTGTGVLVSIKKYNPSQSEIDNASRPSKNSPMNYLMAPFEATNISMYNKGFESRLYSLNKEGKVLWDITLGYSEKSVASPVTLYNDFIFAGESVKDDGKVAIQKIDAGGKVVWRKELDSLNNVNDIIVEGDRVSVLVSFDASKKVKDSDGSFYEHVYPVYFFVQLNISSGELIKKEYQKMANYLSSLDYKNPKLNSDYSYFLNNDDSAIFLNVTKLESGSVVSGNAEKKYKIVQLAASPDAYHLLTLAPGVTNKNLYNLVSDYYAKEKKYDIELPLEYHDSDRRFVFTTSGDSLAVVVANPKNITMAVVDINGKAALYKRSGAVISPVIAAGFYSGKIFIVQVDGRMKPGSAGKLKVDYY